MSLSRDRLARPVDISTFIPNAARRVGLIVDEPGLHRALQTPVNEAGSSETVRAELGRGSGSRPNPRIRALRRAQSRRVLITSSGLPSWYPRTPLRDITAVVRAIERRRACSSDSSDRKSDVLQIFDENAEFENTANRDKSDAFITPKKLLASIEKVREDFIKDERRVHNTPAAKKAEWDGKIRTLMSMR